MKSERSLRREDWERATLSAIAEGSLAAVHIDELAHRLGVTKGSFYWHYDGRDELIGAALKRWRDEAITALDVISELSARERLEALARASLHEDEAGHVEVALAGVVDDERVTPFIEAVVARRMDVLEEAFEALGAADAEQAALVANAIYAGYLHCVRVDPARGRGAAEAVLRTWSGLVEAV